jgi:GntR family transcriptional regulator
MLDDGGNPARAGRQTLRSAVTHALQAEIAAGDPPVGQLLPGEHELCARFRVSRHTIREALRELADRGLVNRKQGSGTRVVSALPQGRYVQSMRTLEQLRQYASDTRHVLRDIDLAARLRGDEAEAVDARPRQRWVRIEGTRFDGSEAICATVVLVAPRFAAFLDGVRQHAEAGTIYGLIEQRSGERITSAEQEIAARATPPSAAHVLGVEPGTPALLFTRRYLVADNRIMVCSLNWHRADRFTYRMRLRRDD